MRKRWRNDAIWRVNRKWKDREENISDRNWEREREKEGEREQDEKWMVGDWQEWKRKRNERRQNERVGDVEMEKGEAKGGSTRRPRLRRSLSAGAVAGPSCPALRSRGKSQDFHLPSQSFTLFWKFQTSQ